MSRASVIGLFLVLASYGVLDGRLAPRAFAVSTATGGAGQAPTPCAAAPKPSFGTAKKTAVSMEGKIYFLPEGANKLPDFGVAKSEGSIWTSEWNVPEREFEEGFPGVTNRFEWFALDYRGSVYVPKTGEYGFRLGSDDGSKLYFDDKVIIDLDGEHSWEEKTGTVTLSQGDHRFRLSFYQGPASFLGLQLFVTPPGGEEKVFRLQDFNRAVAESRSQLGVEESDTEIHVKFGAEVLFDTGKYELKPAATTALTQLADLLGSYPGYPIVIEGHTDNVGTPASNKTLSENRAAAVKKWLVETGRVPDGCIRTQGFGDAKPVASNATADGRQKNRRVEVRLLKPGSTEEKDQ